MHLCVTAVYLFFRDIQLFYRGVQLLQEMYSYYVEMYSCYRCTGITGGVKLFYRDDYKELTVHIDVQLLYRDVQLLFRDVQLLQMYRC